ncbi:PWWP domain-containing DNA repair factor 3B-like isoform X1 [Xyrichtys novacula]|uniref:PWWP domain-containing DNA repair factor 3B-like isoform X1 n=1 Tax=Xyrichtys novacula TaxID=13765 RepID=A0AAV1EJL0_XYRNO|nr:PWWP domain-containing DNA repair factor 3B-like isoform X1 [Xyrichtys novacula]
MKVRSQKKRKTQPKRTSSKRATTATVSPQASDESEAVPDNALAASSSPCTPKRRRVPTEKTPEACLTSTPVHSSSTDLLSDISESPLGSKRKGRRCKKICTQLETSEINSPSTGSNSQTTRRGVKASKPVRARKRVTKEQTCVDTNGAPAKRRRGRIKAGSLQKDVNAKSSGHSRPRFEPEEDNDESLLSSDLSIELSHHEEQLLSLSIQEDIESEDEEEEELPSFLMQEDKKPPSITAGAFVWHKYRTYPFWPALVKSVIQKQKKASILYIDQPHLHQRKGLTVPLKDIKPFDCEEADELVCKAKEMLRPAIEWSLELITDYKIRKACGSFSGSFIEYFAHDMSYPVRRKYPQDASKTLTIADPLLEMSSDDLQDDSFSEQQEEITRSSKRLLPDRSHAAYNRANEKLVQFIVKQRKVEGRLLAVIGGQQQSQWLRSFLSASHRQVVNVYLEDDQQLEQVYRYLNELFSSAVATAPCLAKVKSTNSVFFVLDVLLPEAIIYAIAGVEKVSVKKAEEKYLKGRCVSNRERQEFDLMIEKLIKKKLQNQNNTPVLSSETIV